MLAYKGFNKDMTCRGFQFEEGKEYREEKAELCECGFHACENPLDCFDYYSPAESVYHEVELDELSDRKSDDSKICGKHIKVGARLSIAKLCELHFEYVKSRCTNENNAGNSGAATAGDYGAATAGNCGAATAGYSGAATAGYSGAATAGDRGAATAGDRGAATAGDRGAATAGDYGAATAGDYGAATAGYSGAATSRGRTVVGENGAALARGNNLRVKGGLGAILVIAEESKDDYDIIEWKAEVVDGKKIKANTWYKLENGEFVEVDETP